MLRLVSANNANSMKAEVIAAALLLAIRIKSIYS